MRLSGILRIVAALFLAASGATAAERRPNVILIMADDLGYECLACNGSESYKTPQLDKLAASGARFEHCHVQPLCTPTRVQLMTGQYNVRNYVRFGLLEWNQTTFAHLFKQAGYATGIVGKWQLGGDYEGPGHFGFDEYCLWQLNRRPSRYPNPGLEINGKQVDYATGEYGPDIVCDYAVDFIERHREEPFLLYYPMMLTHGPYVPTPKSDAWDPKATREGAHQAKRFFADMVSYMDGNVGRIVAKLDELKLRERTLIIFLGDNGTGKGTETRWRGQTVIGGKGTMTQQGTRVPLVVNWPGTVAAGTTVTDLVDSTDFLPTICEAAGIEIPAKLPIDGRSFLPQAKGETGQPRDWVYCWYWPHPDDKSSPRAFAMNHRYRLFDDGTLWKVNGDYDETPVMGEPSAEAASAKQELTAALENFQDARPESLGAGDKQAEPKKKKRKNAR